MSNKEILLPCMCTTYPRVLFVLKDNKWKVICPECGCFKEHDDKEQAVKDWNKLIIAWRKSL